MHGFKNPMGESAGIAMSPGAVIRRPGRRFASLLAAVVLTAGLFLAAEGVAALVGYDPQDLPQEPTLRSQVSALLQWSAEGPGDCVIVGPSTVQRGLDPRLVASAYARVAGAEIRCFNFGLPGLDNETAVLVARALDRRFAPPILVVGMMPVERARQSPRSEAYARDPWVLRHAEIGAEAPPVWERTRVYRLMSGARRTPIRADGFALAERNTRQIHVLDLMEDAQLERDFRAADFAVALSPSTLPASAIALLMPVEPEVVARIPGLDTAPDRFLASAARAGKRAVSAYHLPLSRTQWIDPIHLGTDGAEVLSTWLGSAIARIAMPDERLDR